MSFPKNKSNFKKSNLKQDTHAQHMDNYRYNKIEDRENIVNPIAKDEEKKQIIEDIFDEKEKQYPQDSKLQNIDSTQADLIKDFLQRIIFSENKVHKNMVIKKHVVKNTYYVFYQGFCFLSQRYHENQQQYLTIDNENVKFCCYDKTDCCGENLQYIQTSKDLKNIIEFKNRNIVAFGKNTIENIEEPSKTLKYVEPEEINPIYSLSDDEVENNLIKRHEMNFSSNETTLQDYITSFFPFDIFHTNEFVNKYQRLIQNNTNIELTNSEFTFINHGTINIHHQKSRAYGFEKILQSTDLSDEEYENTIRIFDSKNPIFILRWIEDDISIFFYQNFFYESNSDNDNFIERITKDRVEDLILSSLERKCKWFERKIPIKRNKEIFWRKFSRVILKNSVVSKLILMLRKKNWEKKFNFDNQNFLNTEKGLFDLNTRSFVDYSPNLKFTYILKIKNDDELIKKTINGFYHIFNNDEKTLNTFLYFLTFGFIPRNGLSHLIVFKGLGNEGKRYFIDFIRKAFSPLSDIWYNLNIRTSQSSYVNSKLMDLPLRKIIVVDELNRSMNTSFLKNITGKDTISCRKPRSNISKHIKFHGTFLTATNNDLHFISTEYAMKRRIKIFYTKTSPSEDVLKENFLATSEAEAAFVGLIIKVLQDPSKYSPNENI